MTLTLTRGASRTIRLTVLDPSGAAVDLTGTTVYFTVGNGAQALISKSSADTAQIQILAQSGATKGQADIKFSYLDTAAIRPAPYSYDCWLKLATGEHLPLVAPDTFVITDAVTVIP